MTSASDFVPAGAPDQWITGCLPAPWQLNAGPICFPLKSGLVTVMLSGTATRTVLGPPIRPQPLTKRSAAVAATAGTHRPDIPANRRTRQSCLTLTRPIRSDRMRTQPLTWPVPVKARRHPEDGPCADRTARPGNRRPSPRGIPGVQDHEGLTKCGLSCQRGEAERAGKNCSSRRSGLHLEQRCHAGGSGGRPPTSARAGHGEVGSQPTSMLSRSSALIPSGGYSRT
jgi:hypothetical protein